MSDVRMDLDSLIESAWRKFREALADAMEEMDEGDCLEIMTNPGAEVEDGESTYVRVLRFYDSIQVELASNRRLAAKHKLTKPGRSQLHELGFARPTKATPHYWATFAARLVDQAAPFAAEHLQRLAARMCGVVSRHDKALAYRVGGRVFLDPSPTVVDDDGPGADEAIHPVMQCMLQLDADKPGSVRPKVAAKLCGYDSQLLLDLIRWNEEQECAWRAARDEAFATDRDEAEVCEIERAHAHQTVRVLRKALRRVLLG